MYVIRYHDYRCGIKALEKCMEKKKVFPDVSYDFMGEEYGKLLLLFIILAVNLYKRNVFVYFNLFVINYFSILSIYSRMLKRSILTHYMCDLV